jgi:hypothetical protein
MVMYLLLHTLAHTIYGSILLSRHYPPEDHDETILSSCLLMTTVSALCFVTQFVEVIRFGSSYLEDVDERFRLLSVCERRLWIILYYWISFFYVVTWLWYIVTVVTMKLSTVNTTEHPDWKTYLIVQGVSLLVNEFIFQIMGIVYTHYRRMGRLNASESSENDVYVSARV